MRYKIVETNCHPKYEVHTSDDMEWMCKCPTSRKAKLICNALNAYDKNEEAV